jgi:SAM-dependent methyltransferase
MMTEAILEWRNYRYFPYELDFARLEVERLFLACPQEDLAGLRIPSSSLSQDGAERLTYFSRVLHPSGSVTVPQQTRLEASAQVEERERQATRYSAHGLHEYKGKFNPQVVRAIANILGLKEGAWILDPFCGSGTTLLECAHLGWNVVGVDRNPLAVRIANAKLHALRRSNGPLQAIAAAIVIALGKSAAVLSGAKRISRERMDEYLGRNWIHELPQVDYLLAWFSLSVLAQVAAIRRAINTCSYSKDRAVFEVILSDLLRKVSLQEPADLRIRRRKEPASNYPLIDLFIEALPKRIERIARARLALGAVRGRQLALFNDICSIDLRQCAGLPITGFDAVITSPPYETALPYIDTQRLSLVLLGDIKSSEIQRTERALIGARDISTSERRALEEAIRSDKDCCSIEVRELCRELLAAVMLPGNGFRRKNRPALVYRYFRNMAAFFVNVKSVMKSGAKLALVVGKNRTTLGGHEYEIDTPRLLAEVAEGCGYSRVEEREMDTYPRYDIHRNNSIDTETLVILAAP